MIDLRAQHGHRHQLTLDSSADIDGPTRDAGIWSYQVACKPGHVYPHGEQVLGAYADRLHLIASLIGIPGVKVHVRGDTECSVTFPADEPGIFGQVARVLQPFRNSQMSEAELEQLAAMGFKASPVDTPWRGVPGPQPRPRVQMLNQRPTAERIGASR
jgi:hypothetical protein